MARIRSIKPEWLESESLLELGSDARLLSVSLILLCDDWGNCKGSVKLIGAKVWPFLGPEGWTKAETTIAELESIGYLSRYDGGKHLHLNGWFEHQKVDKPGRPQCPMPQFAIDSMPPKWREKYETVAKSHRFKVLGDDNRANFSDEPESVGDTPENPRELSRTFARVSQTSATDLGPRTKDLGSRRESAQRIAAVPLGESPKVDPLDAQAVWDAYRQELSPRAGVTISSDGGKVIREALREWTREQLVDSLRGHKLNPWRTEKAGRVRVASLLGSSDTITEGLDWLARASPETIDDPNGFTWPALAELAESVGMPPIHSMHLARIKDGFKTFDDFAAAVRAQCQGNPHGEGWGTTLDRLGHGAKAEGVPQPQNGAAIGPDGGSPAPNVGGASKSSTTKPRASGGVFGNKGAA